jgi:hypothetical protein
MEVSSIRKLRTRHALITCHQFPFNYRCLIHPCIAVRPLCIKQAQPLSIRYYDRHKTLIRLPTLAYAMHHLTAPQYTVRNDVTVSHVLSVTFVWPSSVFIPLSNRRSAMGNSLSMHIIIQGVYIIRQLSLENSRRFSAACECGRKGVVCYYDKRYDRKL